MPLLPYLAQLVSEEVQKALKSLRRLRLLLKASPLSPSAMIILHQRAIMEMPAA